MKIGEKGTGPNEGPFVIYMKKVIVALLWNISRLKQE